jgi:hypothetical protein
MKQKPPQAVQKEMVTETVSKGEYEGFKYRQGSPLPLSLLCAANTSVALTYAANAKMKAPNMNRPSAKKSQADLVLGSTFPNKRGSQIMVPTAKTMEPMRYKMDSTMWRLGTNCRGSTSTLHGTSMVTRMMR